MNTVINEEKILKSIQEILNSLPPRYKEILIKRFGLKEGEKRKTLEVIGQDYGITRERIRQIESSAKKIILESKELNKKLEEIVKELKKTIEYSGGLIPEKDLLNKFAKSENTKDYLHFVLQLAEPFSDIKKNDITEKIWYTDKNSFEAFEKSLDRLYRDLKTNEVLSEKEIIDRFSEKLAQHTNNKKLLKNETVKKLIALSKKIRSNKLGQWGRAESRAIIAKGVKDYAYLVLSQIKKPMHFTDLTKEINKVFNINANVATVHNELIRDDRFILVGRGEYALKEWGKYSGGTVKEVITQLLKENKKGLSRDEIIKRVLKVKKIREQTILINLSDKAFKKNKEGLYVLAK